MITHENAKEQRLMPPSRDIVGFRQDGAKCHPPETNPRGYFRYEVESFALLSRCVADNLAAAAACSLS